MNRLRVLRRRLGPRRDLRVLAVRDDVRSLQALAPHLTVADRAAARRLKDPARRRAHLLARALLRLGLTEAGRSRSGLLLRTGRRPLERTRDRRRHALTISHGGGWVMVGLAPGLAAGRRVGLDVEARDRRPDPRVGRRLPWRDAPATIARWTRAEAALKADGHGLAALGSLRALDDGAGFSASLAVERAPWHRVRVWRLGAPTSRVVVSIAIAAPRPHEARRD